MKSSMVVKKKYKCIYARIAVVFSVIFVSSAFLCGCEYSSLDEYLDILELTDNDYNDPTSLFSEEIEDTEVSDEPETESIDDASDSSTFDEKEPADSDFASFYRKFFDTDTDSEVKKVREDAGLTEKNINEIKKQQEGNYAFDKLTELLA